MSEPSAPALVQPKKITMIRRDDPAKFADYWIIYAKDCMISSSDRPAHPQGVWAYQDVDDWSKYNRRLGKRSTWEALPEAVKKQLVYFFTPEPTKEAAQ